MPQRRPRVLYAEDELALHRLVTFWLDDAGFEVECVPDGAAALAAVRRDRPDVVVTDAMMPEMSGDELVDILKADPELATIPIVMATAAASPLRRERMRARGVRAVLGKPLDEVTFVEAVRQALDDDGS